MLKCLILAYDFPPYTSMGGQRPYGWLTYLKEFGIEPTVVTRQWPAEIKSKVDYSASTGETVTVSETEYGKVVAVPYRANLRDRLLQRHGFEKKTAIRKFLTLSQSVLQHFSTVFDNKARIYAEAKKILAKEHFDVLIVTGEPFVLFRYAYKLSKKFTIPWVADYRDCWSDNFVINGQGGINKLLHRTFFRSFEKKYVSTAMFITTAAPFFQKELQKLFPKKQVSVVYNGFVSEQFKSLGKPKPNSKMTIAFAGTIYPFQPVEIFLEGLQLFVQTNRGSQINAVFYGTNFNEEQKKRVLGFHPRLAKYITTTDRLNQKELFNQMNNADVLLLFDNKGMISGKLYEYLALGKYILMAGRDYGSMEEIISQSSSGTVCADGRELARTLQVLYAEWEAAKSVKCGSANVGQFSRREQCHRLAELIKSV